MDVPLALNDIKIRCGLQGDKRKSSTFSQQTGAGGFLSFMLSVFSKIGLFCEQLYQIKEDYKMNRIVNWRCLMLSLGLVISMNVATASSDIAGERGYYDKHIIIAVDQYRGDNTSGADYKSIYDALVKVLKNDSINTSHYMQCTLPKGTVFDPSTDEISLFTFGFTKDEIKNVSAKTNGNDYNQQDAICQYILNKFFKEQAKCSDYKDGVDGFLGWRGPIRKAIFEPQECGNNYSSVVFPNVIRKVKTSMRAKEYYLIIVSSFIGGPTNVGNAIDLQNIVRDWFHNNAEGKIAKAWFERGSSLEEQFTRTEIFKIITKYDKSQNDGSKTNALVLVGYKIEPKVFSASYAPLKIKNKVELKETSFGSSDYYVNDLEILFPHDDNLRIDSIALDVIEEKNVIFHKVFDNIHSSTADDMIYVASLSNKTLNLRQHNVGDLLVFQPIIYATPLSSFNKEELLPLIINVPQQDFLFTSDAFRLAPSVFYMICALVALLLATVLFAIWYYRGRLVKAHVDVKIDNISKQRYMNINTTEEGGIRVTNAPCWYLRPGINEQRIHVRCSMSRETLAFAKKYPIKLSYMVRDLDENYDFTFRPEGTEHDGHPQKTDIWYEVPNGPFKDDKDFEFNAIAYVDHGKEPDFVGRENVLKLGICFKAELVNNAGEVVKLLDELSNVSYEFIAKEYFPNRELWIALDPGTSGSCIAYGFGGRVVSKDNIHLARNFVRHTDGSEGWDPIFPSKIKIDSDSFLFDNPGGVELAQVRTQGGTGDFWFGNDAEQMWGSNSFQSIKKLLGYDNKLTIIRKNGMTQKIAGRDLAHLLVKGLINRFVIYLKDYDENFEKVIDENERARILADKKALEEVQPKFLANGNFQPSRAIVTVPNNFTLVKILDMVESVRRTKLFKEVHFLYEAEGVLMTYLRENWGNLKDKMGRTIIVFDMGGATINASAFSFDPTFGREGRVEDVTVRTISRIGYGIGGDDIDFALIQIIFSIPSIKTALENLSLDKDQFIRRNKKSILKYISSEFKISYIDKVANRMKTGNVMADMATLWGSLKVHFKEWKVILPEDYTTEDEAFIKEQHVYHSIMKQYVLNNVGDAVKELVNSDTITNNRFEIIFSGRSTLYPGVRETVIDQLKRKGCDLTVWSGFNKVNSNILDDEKVKSAVVEGACWYAMWSQYITIKHDIVTSTFGFIDMKENKEVFHSVVKRGEDLVNGHLKHSVKVYDPTNPNIAFVQMLGSNHEEIWAKKIYHKMNQIIQLTDIDGDVESIEIDVDDKNNFKYRITESSGVIHSGRDVVKDIDILDENSEAYIFAAYTGEDDITNDNQQTTASEKQRIPSVIDKFEGKNSEHSNTPAKNRRGGGL